MVLQFTHTTDKNTHQHLLTANNTLSDIGSDTSLILTYVDGVETSLNSIDSKINSITKLGYHLSSGMLANNGYEIAINATGYKSLRIYGSTTADLDVVATQTTNLAFYTYFDTIQSGSFSKYYECIPDKIKVKNNSGGQITLALQYCLFK